MITIQTYLYPIKMTATIWDPTIFATRNRDVYTKPVTVYQGIDNPVQIRVRNQDQKPVNMAGYTMRIDIQDPLNQLTVQSFGVNFINENNGIGTFVITKDIVNSLTQRQYKLTFRAIRREDDREQPAFTDNNYNVPLDLYVIPAYYADMPPQEGEPEGNDFTIIDGGTIQ